MTLALSKVAPALTAGCTVVLKPAELTPLTAVRPISEARRERVPGYIRAGIAGGAELVTGGTAADGAGLRINSPGMDPNLPFGGLRMAGWERENGREGIEAYTELKTVTVRLA
ncbi:aldehyde dehydrogenase family protein [Sinomonas sp. R1AF57]|uniref:aldehyde dehydrogenase family protein n=1 Tax=Sinomonas sp. R1AF57 TaxID=2020377 RepID=UPI001AC00040|nr:aldehyde dehydrogenase family protein [Sinomonas sp. R1AF57]